MSIFQKKKEFKRIETPATYDATSMPVIDADEIDAHLKRMQEEEKQIPAPVKKMEQPVPQAEPSEESIDELEERLKLLREEKLRKEREEVSKTQSVVKVRAVPVELMFNEISDRIDLIEQMLRQLYGRLMGEEAD